MIYENINNINKIFNDKIFNDKIFNKHNYSLELSENNSLELSENNYSLDKIFSNINTFLYENIIELIKSDNTLGNNILEHLKDSFNLSTYFILKYLTCYLYKYYNESLFTDSKLEFNFFNKNKKKLLIFNKINNYIL